MKCAGGAIILLISLFCLLGGGLGLENYNNLSIPLIIEELLEYSRDTFLLHSNIYTVTTFFDLGLGGYFYIAIPFAVFLGCRGICDDLQYGIKQYKILKVGRSNYIIGSIIATYIEGIISILLGLSCYMLILNAKLPGNYDWIHIGIVVRNLCLIMLIITLLCVTVALITQSVFYTMSIPILIIYIQDEFLLGRMKDSSAFAIRSLFWSKNITEILSFCLLISTLLGILIYMIEKRGVINGK